MASAQDWQHHRWQTRGAVDWNSWEAESVGGNKWQAESVGCNSWEADYDWKGRWRDGRVGWKGIAQNTWGGAETPWDPWKNLKPSVNKRLHSTPKQPQTLRAGA